MASDLPIPKVVWKLLRIPPRLAYRLGLGPVIGRRILLLTTTGRKTGLARVTPLQYELVGGCYYVGAARGLRTDWFRNIQADPRVAVQVKNQRFRGRATAVTDPEQVADFLEYRLRRHPRFVGLVLRMAGYPSRPTRQQLKAYARHRALVAIHPEDSSGMPETRFDHPTPGSEIE